MRTDQIKLLLQLAESRDQVGQNITRLERSRQEFRAKAFQALRNLPKGIVDDMLRSVGEDVE